MKKRKCNVVLLALAVALMAVIPCSAESDGAKSSAENSRMVSLLSLKTRLIKDYRKYSDNNLVHLDLYVKALAKIEATHGYLADRPYDKNASRMFSECSLLTEAAGLQLINRWLVAEILKIEKKRDDILSKINSVHQEFTEIERGHGTRLQADLAEERRKAKQLKNEADKKFKSMESELVKVRKDARGTIISMSDILFEFGKADITADLKTTLAKISGILLVYKESEIVVEGHTDNQGGAAYNQTLSEKRAENVMAFLGEQGVNEKRMKAVGYGFKRPIADNKTKAGRQKNRRVDLVVLDQKLLK